MSAISEHYAGKECPGDWTDEDLKNTAAELFGAGASVEDAHFIARMLLDRGFRIVTYQQADAAKRASN